MTLVVVGARVVIAATFLLAGLGKLAVRDQTKTGLKDLSVPQQLVAPISVSLPLLELPKSERGALLRREGTAGQFEHRRLEQGLAAACLPGASGL